MLDKVVITDTSCLIALSKLEIITILQKLYSEVIVTSEIVDEFGEPLPDWIKIQNASNPNYKKILENVLDAGEASAIALAFELKDVVLILDDLKGRKEAKKLGFKITGTLGVLYKAKQNGFISEIKIYLEKLKVVGFRISEEIEMELLLKSNE